jgi:hypothetical protein
MAAPKRKGTRWSSAADAPDDLGPSERIAHEIVLAYRDLLPSVDRIMNAELSDPDRLYAITLFQNSLGAVGDKNRDPRVAIESSRGAG